MQPARVNRAGFFMPNHYRFLAVYCIIFIKIMKLSMKTCTNILSAFFLMAITNVAMAQKQLGEGSFEYDISISSNKSSSPIANTLNGATLTVYLSDGKSRTEMNSSLGSEVTVFDNREREGFILKEYSGQKLMITMNAANWADKNKLYDNLNFQVSNELVTIGDYKCKKAVATMPDGKVFTVYFNPEISLGNKNYNNAFPQLPGIPVQFELQSGDLSFKYSLKKISYENVGSAKFAAPRAGFRVMTYEENQQLKRNK